MDDSLTGLVALAACIALNATLKIAYVAIINASKAKLKELADEGSARAEHALALANDATRMLASQQLVDVLLRFAIALVAAVAVVPPLRDALADQGMESVLVDLMSYGGVLLIVAILTLVFGEMLPANIALGHADAIALRAAGPVSILARALAPALRLLRWISGLFATPFVGRSGMALVTEEEIKLMVDAGSEGGAIEDEEKEMIYSIFQFGDTLAREVMVPRIDVVALEINTSVAEALNKIVEAGHSRIPVYEESIDHIRGLLYAKDLLADMQQRKIHLAVVVDEYGGTAGLVTLEDLIEEIVGEIRDEYDFDEEEMHQQISEREYIFDAGIDLDDLNRLLDLDLPTDESDTLGGYVFSKLGKVPIEGEVVEDADMRLEVLRVDDRRLRKIRLTRIQREAPPEDIREEPAAEAD